MTWRSPGLHFVLLGGLLFLARTGLERPAPIPPIPPVRDEEVLYRKAVSTGLDKGSAVVDQRLLENMRFLEGPADPKRQLAEAVALGFDRTDPVVRRVVTEQMRLVAGAPGHAERPTDAELAGYLRRHEKEFRQPGRVRLTHVFLDADRRGAALVEDARRLLGRLRAEAVPPEEAPALGDPFLPGHHPAAATPRDLAKIYGPDFARAAARLPVGRWEGPVASSYGLHLVWVHENVPGAPATLAEVRNQVLLGLAQEKREARLAAFVKDARQRQGGEVAR